MSSDMAGMGRVDSRGMKTGDVLPIDMPQAPLYEQIDYALTGTGTSGMMQAPLGWVEAEMPDM